MNPQQVFHPVNNRVNEVLFQPVPNIFQSVPNPVEKPSDSVQAEFLEAVADKLSYTLQSTYENARNVDDNRGCKVGESFKVFRNFNAPDRFAEKVNNGIGHVSPIQGADNIGCGLNNILEKTAKALGHGRNIETLNELFNAVPRFRCHLFPVVLLNPLAGFIESTPEKVADRLTYQLPIQPLQKSDHEVEHSRNTPCEQTTGCVEVDLFQSGVDHIGDMIAELAEVSVAQERIGGLDCAVDTFPDLRAKAAPINLVHSFVHFVRKDFAKAVPISLIERFFQTVNEVTKIAVNLRFLEHGLEIGKIAAAAALVRVEDIQLVEIGKEIFCLAGGFADRIGIFSLRLDRLGVDALPTQFCEELRQKVQHIGDLIRQEIKSRSESVHDGGNSGRQRPFQIQSVGCQRIQRFMELRTGTLAVEVQIPDTLFQPLRQSGDYRSNRTIHSNSL